MLACSRLFHRLLVVLVADSVEWFGKENGEERKPGRKEKGLTLAVFFSCSLFFSPSPPSERLEQGAQDQTIEPTAVQTNDLPIEIARPPCPSQRLSLGIPIKIAIIEKIESVRGTMGRGKPRALSFSFSPASPLIKRGPALRRREAQSCFSVE